MNTEVVTSEFGDNIRASLAFEKWAFAEKRGWPSRHRFHREYLDVCRDLGVEPKAAS